MNTSMIKRIENRLDNWVGHHPFWGIFGICVISWNGFFLGLFFLQGIFGIPFSLLLNVSMVSLWSILSIIACRWIIHERKRIWNQRQLLWEHWRLILMFTLNLVPYFIVAWWYSNISDKISNPWLTVLFFSIVTGLLLIILLWPFIIYTWPRIVLVCKQRETLEIGSAVYLAYIVILFLSEVIRPFLW